LSLLQGRKIGIVLTIKQLGDTAILKEIEKILLAGAELFIIPLELPEKKEKAIIKVQHFFRQLSRETHQKGAAKEAPVRGEADLPGRLSYPSVDLVAVFPNSEHFLSFLDQALPEEHTSPPLVVISLLEGEPAFALGYISSLMKKKGIFFVPFGPVSQRLGKKDKKSYLYSRLDLLTETCAAALEGLQIKPFTWENHLFPH